MGNLDRFRAVWRDHRNAVRDLRSKRDEEVKVWEGYAGSERGDAKLKEIDEAFAADLSRLRDDYASRINNVIQAMKGKAEAVEENVTEAPTEEMVRTLQAASLMTEMTLDDYDRIAKLCAGNRVALDALASLAKERMPESVRGNVRLPPTIGERALGQLKVIASSSRNLASWDGMSREEAIGVFMDEKEAGIPVSSRTSLQPTSAAEVDPSTSSDKFFDAIIGILYDPEAVAVMD